MSQAISEIAGARKLSGNASVAVLTRLWLDGPLRPRDLAQTTAMSSGGTTKVIDRLDRHGLVKRDNAEVNDGRGVVVALSPKGERIAEAILEAVGPVMFELSDDIDSYRRAID